MDNYRDSDPSIGVTIETRTWRGMHVMMGKRTGPRFKRVFSTYADAVAAQADVADSPDADILTAYPCRWSVVLDAHNTQAAASAVWTGPVHWHNGRGPEKRERIQQRKETSP